MVTLASTPAARLRVLILAVVVSTVTAWTPGTDPATRAR
jgi:hypothetical protein